MTRIVRCPHCDGTGVTLDTAQEAPTPAAAPPMTELPPPMPQRPAAPAQDEPPHPAGVGPGQYVAMPPGPAPRCAAHGEMRYRPGGMSKAGKPYNAFWGCTDRDCKNTVNI